MSFSKVRFNDLALFTHDIALWFLVLTHGFGFHFPFVHITLTGLNCTVAYLGDAFLKNSRLVEIVQDTLTTMSLVATQPNEEIQFPLLLKEDVVAVIAVEPLIKQLLLQSNHVGTPPPSPTPEQHNDDHHTRRRPPKVLKKEDEEVLMRKPQPQPPQLQQKLVLKSQLESYIESLPKQPHTTKPLGKKPTCSSQAQLPSQLLLLRENQEQERQLMKLQPQLPKQKPQPLSPKPQPLSPKQKPQKSQSKPKQQFMLPKQSSQSKQQQQQVMFPKQQKSHSKPKQPLQPKQQQPQKSQPKQSKPKQKQPSLPMRKPILKTGGAASKQFDPSALYWSRPAEYNTSSSHSGEQGDDEGTEAYGGLSSFYETVATTEEELHSPPSYIPSVPTDEYTSMNSFLPPAMRCLIRVGSSTLSRSNSMTSHTTMSHPQTTTTTTTTKNHGKDTVGENNKEEDDDKKHWSYCRKSSKSLFSSHPL